MITMSDFNRASKAVMSSLGFYDGGTQYDESEPAWFGLTDSVEIVVAKNTDCDDWFAEAYPLDDLQATIDTRFGKTPDDALANLVKSIS